MNTDTGKQVLFFGKVTPEEVAARAQVLLVDHSYEPVRWYIFAPAPYRAQGTGEVPTVTCAVVDCTAIPNDDESMTRMATVIGRCVDTVHGVINKSGLLTGLAALGAVVEYPNGLSNEICPPAAFAASPHLSAALRQAQEQRSK